MRKSDLKGNVIYSTIKKGVQSFYIGLRGEEYPRSIGKFKDSKLIIRRNRDRHLYHKMNAYGFNDVLLRYLFAEHGDMEVEVHEVKSKIMLVTTIEEILSLGKYLYFATQGFEKQIFLGLSSFEQVRKK